MAGTEISLVNLIDRRNRYGFGRSVVTNLAENLDGQLTIQSHQYTGTIFEVLIRKKIIRDVRYVFQ